MIDLNSLFVPVKNVLVLCWFVLLCVFSPTCASVVLIGMTAWVIYKEGSKKPEYKKSGGKHARSSNRPEYPC